MKPNAQSRINDVLYHIHRDISSDLGARELAKIAAYSEQHFHRVFKDVVGESVAAYIRRVRIEYAANQLMFSSDLTVLEVANNCGFESVSSFSRVFKKRFQVSPGEWRKGDIETNDKPYLSDSEIAAGYRKVAKDPLAEPRIVEVEARKVAYVRHKGYGRSIKQAWLLLQAWAKHEGRCFDRQFGLHHSNPAWIPLDQCRYVACIEIEGSLSHRGKVNELVIPGGLYGVFSLQGKYGELLPQVSKIMEEWLPTSGLKMRSTPAYVEYHKNHFLEGDECFELEFYLPLSFY
ncbi:AraC family transcriptional regulator [Vibrio sonorensis]|uniref:AraC family transcriptional regulator n=1 Tax=Vibrio sonorensis TaxID=1004316 RepID=UPI0008DAFE5D|nr:GyrI-like domain-containing protein [Vibrio sonorensis]